MIRTPPPRALAAALLLLALSPGARAAVMVGADNPNVPAPKAVTAPAEGGANPLSVEGPRMVLPGQDQQQDARERMRLMEADSKLIKARKFFDQKKFPEAIEELRRLDREMPFNPAIKMALADSLLKTGAYSNAVQEARSAVELAPQDPVYRLLLSQAYTYNLEFEPALEEVTKCLERNPNNPTARLNKGVLLNKLGRAGEAIDYFKSEVEKQPDYLAGHNMLGVIYYARADYTNAIHHFDQMTRLAPDDAGGPINAGLSLLAVNQPREALERFRGLIKKDPLNPEGYGFAGLCLERLREADKALQMYRQALYVEPNYQDGYTMLAGLLIAQNQLAEAEKTLRLGIEKAPGATTLHRLLAELMRRNGRHKEATQVMLDALDRGFAEPDNWRSFLSSYQKVLEELNKGAVQIAPGRITNNVDRAVWHYKMFGDALSRTNMTAGALHLVHATLLDGTRPEYFNDLASLSGRFLGSRSAQPLFLASLYLNPGFEPARKNLLATTLKTETADLENHLNRLVDHLKRQNDQPEVNFCAALLLTRLNRPSEALPYFARAVEFAPGVVPYRMEYGKSLYESGNLRGALDQVRACGQLMPDNFQLQYLTAWVALQMEQPDVLDLDLAETEAAKAVKAVGKRDPRYPWLLARTLAARGKWNEAVAAAQPALELATTLKKDEWVKRIKEDIAGFQKKLPAPRDAQRGSTEPLFDPPLPLVADTTAAAAKP